ncbi:MAG TPA: ABC transporter ATP-binding protein [Streptosporangiaceae bacterium]|jgi:oligopeptide/dipeptide ABC transporter ATP-binding protein
MTASDDLLSVRELSVSFSTPAGVARAVNEVSLSIWPGERLALVGESGSGKTVTAMSLLGLVRGASISGHIRYAGRDLLALAGKQWRTVRGREIGIVLQDPNSSLNPTMRVRKQIFEALRLAGVSRDQRDAEAAGLLAKVGISDPARILRSYPFQLSGGQQQRVVISIALAQQPRLLIADEPTTALDVKVQAQVLRLLLRLGEQQHMSILLITHDLSVVAGFAERVAVMYGGRIVELGATTTIFQAPRHPYTQGLLRSTPRADAGQGARFDAIPGEVPPATGLPSGCAFRSRCPFARPRCAAELPLLRGMSTPGHLAACHFAGELGPAGNPAAESSDAPA